MSDEASLTGIVLLALGVIVVSIGYGIQLSTPSTGGQAGYFYNFLFYLAALTQGGGWVTTGVGAALATYESVGKHRSHL
ncbi:MAG: hypothetical protein HY296_02665 [Thaumarchaeota archaeon]|nr:hypothetical protein [Nitrososphaerota archaeon]